MRLVSDESSLIGSQREVQLRRCRRPAPRPSARSSATPSFQATSGVGAGRDVVDAVAALGVGDREEAVAEHQDEGAHVRVDVAEHPHDARAVEAHRLRAAGGIAPEVERLRLREREHVVVGRGRCSGSPPSCPTVMASTWGTNVSSRWSMRARGCVALVERAARRGLQVDDAAAAVGAAGAAGIAEPPRRWGAAGLARRLPELDAAAQRRRRRGAARPGRPAGPRLRRAGRSPRRATGA